MKKWIILLVMLWAGNCWGATYTVCASGCSQTTVAGIFSSYDLEPDDIVEIQADSIGGSKTYYEALTVGSNDMGSDGHPLIIKGRDGDTVTIDAAGGAYAILAYYLDYITVQNLLLVGGTSATVRIRTNAGVDEPIGWTFDDVHISGGSVNGLQIDGGSGHVLKNSTLTAPQRPLFVATVAGMSVSNCTSTAGSVGGFIFATSTNITASNSTSSGTTGTASGWSFTTVTGTNSITGCQGNSNGGNGFLFASSTGFTISNSTATGNTSSGFVINGTSATFTLNSCTAYSNLIDGFVTDNSANNITYNKCLAHSNGITSPTTEGDGFTSHLTNYNINLNYCVSRNNYNTGIAMIGTSSGIINNCLLYGNGEAGGPRAGLYLFPTAVNPTTGVSWTVKNTIVVDNLPYEVFLGADIDDDVVLDNNLYYHTAGGNMFSVNSGGAWTSYSDYITAMQGQTPAQELASINADPLFISATDYRLRSTSPAINAGAFVTGVHDVAGVTDYAGQDLYNMPAPDIGAYGTVKSTMVLKGGTLR